MQMHMWPWTTKPVISSTGKFVAIANNTFYGSKLLIFLLWQKIIRILSRDHVPWRYFCKYFWLVICIAKNFIWTNLKVIFSIFRFFFTLRFTIFKYLYLRQIWSYPNKLYINGKLMYFNILMFRWFFQIHLNFQKLTLFTVTYVEKAGRIAYRSPRTDECDWTNIL